MDFASLLEKYMFHVTQCEGTDFVDRLHYSSSGLFTSDEKFELIRISQNPWSLNPADVSAAGGPQERTE